MAAKYRLTITEQDMETLQDNKESGVPTSLFLTPINPDEGLKELQIEVVYGERPVAQTEATPSPEAQPKAEPSIEQEPDVTQAELTPGFTGESAVTSFDSFFKINEEKEKEEGEEDTKDKDDKEDSNEDDTKNKDTSDKPKFGSKEYREKYLNKGKKKKK